MELDTPDVKLLAFVQVNLQRNGLLLVVGIGIGHRREVDVAKGGVSLAQVLQALADLLRVKDVPVFDLELGAEGARVGNRLVAGKRDLFQAVLIALFHRHGDVDGFASLFVEWPIPRRGRIANLGLRIGDQRFEIALCLVVVADALGVFVQLGGVVGLGEQAFQENRVRNADGLQVLHRGLQFARLDRLVALEGNLAHLDLRSFFHHERKSHGSWRNRPNFRGDSRKLPSMGRQQFLDHDLGSLNFGRIVLAFLRQPDLAFLELVENVAL